MTRPDPDIIIIGAGSAGAPAAAQLSADARRRVLLLEAGPDWRGADAPAAMLSANINPFMNDPAHQAQWQWPGLLTRRTRVQAARYYWRGRGLGGSSMVNAQIAIHGTPEAFDEWAEAGAEGWSAATMVPILNGLDDDPAQGRGGGPVPVYREPEAGWGPVDRAFAKAARAAGYPWNPDLNGVTGEGLSCYPYNVREGRRVSTNEAFLEPVRGRANLEVRAGVLVDRILFEGGRAVGVRVHREGEGWTVIGGRTILLCAGAIHSPAILMRSGVGDAAALGGLGIGVVLNRPAVGQHFMDHPMIRMLMPLRAHAISRDRDQRHTNSCVTYSSGLAGGGRRDMILIGYNHRGLGEGGLPSHNGAIGGGIFNAFSRGSVTLASADPGENPVTEENMLDDARDRLRMRDALRRLAGLAEHPAIRAIAEPISFGESGLSMPAMLAMGEDEQDAVLLEQCTDSQHAAGTCRMTAYEDPRGVVDPDLRVKGVDNLYVADASIMPTDCRANLHFTCMAIGVRAAQLIAAKDMA